MAETTTRGTETGSCLVQTVADVMRRAPTLEAVKIDRAKQSVSLATLGQPDPELERVVTEQIRALQGKTPGCRLLEGDPSCATCTVPLDAAVQRNLNICSDNNVTTIARVSCPTAPHFWKWRAFPLPRLVPREVHLEDAETHALEWKQQLIAAVLCGGFALASVLVGGTWRLPLFVASYLCGSWFTAQEVWEHLQQRKLDVHFLMLTVALGSASIGAWGEGAVLLFLFSFSGALEHYAMGRTQREISALFKSAPKSAIVLDEQHRELIVPVAQLTPGMRLLIKPGDQFPVDAELASGSTAAYESNLTGEAAPVEKRVGDTVFAGTINLWGAVESVVVRPASQSALQRIIQLIKEAQHLKAPSQRFTDRFGSRYTTGILALTVVMFFVWWLAFGLPPFTSSAEMRSAFYKAMTLLVVASPCALVLSIPSAVLAAIATGAKRGILFRGGAAVENLADIQVVAMDKTGTLTTGELRVERVESFPAGREREVAELAYSLERLSTHPLARAITRHGKGQGLKGMPLENFQSITGQGLCATLNNEPVLLGRRAWVLDQHAAGQRIAGLAPAEPSNGDIALHQRGVGISEVWVAQGGFTGRITLRDDVRSQARAVVDALRAQGLHTVVLTGDHHAAAEHLKTLLAVDEVRAELKPEQKVEAIREFMERKQRVAMIGDGVNDAPSLAAADIGVAMGARGADAALEQAAVVLMHDRLDNFLTAYQLSRRARAIIRQNLVISLGTVVVLVTCAILGAIPLTLGVVGHEGSTVVVVLNSLRLLWKEVRADQ
jgi:Zn2+/Cd2+-exporting ATPase